MTKIRVPKEIKVGGHTYKVTYRKFLGKDTGDRGVTAHRRQKIEVDPDNPYSQKNATLLHEILHLIEIVFNLDLRDEDTDRISEGLYQVLSDSFGIKFDWSNINGKSKSA